MPVSSVAQVVPSLLDEVLPKGESITAPPKATTTPNGIVSLISKASLASASSGSSSSPSSSSSSPGGFSPVTPDTVVAKQGALGLKKASWKTTKMAGGGGMMKDIRKSGLGKQSMSMVSVTKEGKTTAMGMDA